MSTKVFDNLTSAQLSKRLEDLRAQLVTAEGAAEERQGALESALAEGKGSEKALADLAIARTKLEALRSVIESAEAALEVARKRETLQAELDKVRNAERQAAALTADLEKKKGVVLDFAAKLKNAEDAFDQTAGQLGNVASEVGATSYFPAGEAFPKPQPFNDPESNLRSALHAVSTGIERKREGLERQLAALVSANAEEE